MIEVGVLTVSDRASRGERDDLSGAAVSAWCRGRGYEVREQAVVPDEADAISATLRAWADERRLGLVLTTGGTGMSPRDVTPEATAGVLERTVPGISEQIRRTGLDATPYSVLSRGVAGTRGGTLIVNLPGSPGGVRDGLRELERVVDHAVALLQGVDDDHEVGAV